MYMQCFYAFLICSLLNGCLPPSVAQTDKEEGECDARQEARVISKGKGVLVEGPESPFEKRLSNDYQTYYVIDEVNKVYYVPNFVNLSIAEELQSFCNERFVKSPIRDKVDGSQDVTHDSAIRTSESCVLVPAAVYLSNPRFLEMREKTNPSPEELEVFRIVDVTWEVSKRASSLLSWDPTTVEPLQVVRYTSPDAYYDIHHDHGNFYGKITEQRPWTVLVFLNDVNVGGHTWFPKLELKVVPRAGDAIAWSNVDSNNKANPDMVHAGQPPGQDGIGKYAVNVWLGDTPMDGTNPSLAGSQWGSNRNED